MRIFYALYSTCDTVQNASRMLKKYSVNMKLWEKVSTRTLIRQGWDKISQDYLVSAPAHKICQAGSVGAVPLSAILTHFSLYILYRVTPTVMDYLLLTSDSKSSHNTNSHMVNRRFSGAFHDHAGHPVHIHLIDGVLICERKSVGMMGRERETVVNSARKADPAVRKQLHMRHTFLSPQSVPLIECSD